MEPLLDKNRFPHLYVISASAGTGKTFALSKRIAAYLLSNIKNNDLRNILAITFTINAAKEMKKRVLNWLKGLALSDGFIYSMLGISEKEREFYYVKAIHLIDNIFKTFSRMLCPFSIGYVDDIPIPPDKTILSIFIHYSQM